jgi:uncharacterized protein YggE
VKTFLPLAALALALTMITALPAAAAPPDGRTIVVVATGSVDVLAQPAEWTVGVQVTDQSARKAMNASRVAVARVRIALARAGVPQAELRVTTQLVTADEEDPDASQGFVATKSMRLTAPAQRASLLIDKAEAVGANYFFGPDLSDAQSDEDRSGALSAAVDAARVKAQALAAKTGLVLGDVVDVETGFGYDGLDPNEGKVYATVAVVFGASG